MTQVSKIVAADTGTANASPSSLALQVELAARTVAPLWPLESAIAVNPLSGFEDMPFEQALGEAARLFGARAGLDLRLWRRLSATGRPTREAVRQEAIRDLGGLERAFEMVGPDITLVDCLMARLYDLPIADALAHDGDPSAERVAEWCAAYFAKGVAAIPLGAQAPGLFAAALPLLKASFPTPLVKSVPDTPMAAIRWALYRLAIEPADQQRVLRATVARMPGWAGHIRWRDEQADDDRRQERPSGMADLIALILVSDLAVGARPVEATDKRVDVRRQLAAHFQIAADRFSPAVRDLCERDDAGLALIFQQAAEREFATPLAKSIAAKAKTAIADDASPDAQLLFCIDVRSEPMRRALEAQGAYQTLGYAGFFGLPIAVREPGSPRTRRLPVLVGPQHELALAPVRGAEEDARDYLAARDRDRSLRALFNRLKSGLATGFSTAETVGGGAGLWMALQTFAPGLSARLRRGMGGDPQALAPAIDRHAGGSGLTAGERLSYARAMFALTGMKATARLVVLLGHAGETVNNPYASALDCGACAGHGGAANARAMAAILNDPDTRAALGIAADTHFVAGEHNTTTDDVRLFDLQFLPETHSGDLERLQQSLAAAGEAVRTERARKLGRTEQDLRRGAAHWGEVRPEWGLTGNAAFIVGPRRLTRSNDLGGRAFLHDYDWRIDGQGEALATILTAPMVVAQWINCQYLFSTIDNDRYGAGDKTVHNPVAGIGVVRGNGGDLAVGLPRQTLFHDDGTPAHVPQRLTTIVYAPIKRVETLVEQQAVLRRLFGNGWVRLIVIDPQTGQVRRWADDRELNEDAA